jgi:hypothetical protein
LQAQTFVTIRISHQLGLFCNAKSAGGDGLSIFVLLPNFCSHKEKTFQLTVKIFKKNSANTYHPGSFKFVDNYCEMMVNNQTLAWKVFPNAMATVTKKLPRCPLIVCFFHSILKY